MSAWLFPWHVLSHHGPGLVCWELLRCLYAVFSVLLPACWVWCLWVATMSFSSTSTSCVLLSPTKQLWVSSSNAFAAIDRFPSTGRWDRDGQGLYLHRFHIVSLSFEIFEITQAYKFVKCDSLGHVTFRFAKFDHLFVFVPRGKPDGVWKYPASSGFDLFLICSSSVPHLFLICSSIALGLKQEEGWEAALDPKLCGLAWKYFDNFWHILTHLVFSLFNLSTLHICFLDFWTGLVSTQFSWAQRVKSWSKSLMAAAQIQV